MEFSIKLPTVKSEWSIVYCKFGNFRENFIFADSVKTHICKVEFHDKGVIYAYQ